MKANKPIMLSTPELLEAYWPQVQLLLDTAPITEQFSTGTIKQAILSGQMFAFALVEGTDVNLVLVAAVVPSEKLPSISIVTVAGNGLRGNAREFWEYFKGWCFMNGARAIDAYVPERMEKFLSKELGFKRETIHVRLGL